MSDSSISKEENKYTTVNIIIQDKNNKINVDTLNPRPQTFVHTR